MKILNIILILFIISFFSVSFFYRPNDSTSVINAEFIQEFPQINLNVPLKEDLDIIEGPLDTFPGPNLQKRFPQSWTVRVKSYNDLEEMKKDLTELKALGYKVYSHFNEDEVKPHLLFIGPTLRRSDSEKVINELKIKFNTIAKLERYD